jgi:hypothetical protein
MRRLYYGIATDARQPPRAERNLGQQRCRDCGDQNPEYRVTGQQYLLLCVCNAKWLYGLSVPQTILDVHAYLRARTCHAARNSQHVSCAANII